MTIGVFSRCHLDKLSKSLYVLLMEAMAVGELKTNFSEVLEKVKQGQKVGILYGRAKKPVAMIVPYQEEKKGKRKIGILDGIATVKIIGDGKISEEEFLGL